ncbi:MAG: hypothetical protein ACM3JI_04045 [Anaerolineae bacterium]
MTKQSVRALIGLTSLVLMNTSLFGDSASNGSSPSILEERVAIRSNPLAIETREAIKKQRRQEALEQTESQHSEQKDEQGSNSTLSQKNLMTLLPDYYATRFHWFYGISGTYSDCIVTEDETLWKVSPSDLYKINFWRLSDALTLTMNSGWLFYDRNFDFLLTNTRNGSSVQVTLFIGPVDHGHLSNWIIGISYDRGTVNLKDGTAWSILRDDRYVFDNWHTDHTIIYGRNDSFFSSYDTILYNVNMDTVVRAKQF